MIVSAIEKAGTFLQFVNIGYAAEKEHLKEQTDKDISQLAEKAKELISQGVSYRNAASELGVSLGKIQRIIKKSVSG